LFDAGYYLFIYLFSDCNIRQTRSSADADNALDAFSGQSRPCGISDGTLTHVWHMTNVVTLKLGSEVTQGH